MTASGVDLDHLGDFDPDSDDLPWYDAATSGRWPPLVRSSHLPAVPVQVWVRRPWSARQLFTEHPYSRFVFTPADLSRNRLNPDVLLRRMLPPGMDYEYMLLDRRAALLHSSARYNDADYEPRRIPTWAATEDPDMLLRLCASRRYPRIVVGWFPRGVEVRERNWRVLQFLHRVGAEFPDVKLHLSGSRVFRHMFGLNFSSVDYEPVSEALSHRVVLPNGKLATMSTWPKNMKWIHVLGFSTSELLTKDGRVRFNMMSALWAAEHWRDAEPIPATSGEARKTDPLGVLSLRAKRQWTPLRGSSELRQQFRTPWLDPDLFGQTSPDPDEPYAFAEPVIGAEMVPVSHPVEIAGSRDKILCDSCSLAPKCRVFREGSVCIVSSSPTSRLAESFGTRDTETIKGVLGEILARQVERYERSAVRFRDDDESDITDLKRAKHLMDMENSLVRSTETFMKILDPSFRESNVPSISSTTMHVYNPQVLVADVVRQLEASGVARSQLTPEMIQKALEGRSGGTVPVEGSPVIDGEVQ